MDMCEKKQELMNLVQDYYDEYLRAKETMIQKNCERDLESRSNIDTIRDQEKNNKSLIDQIHFLETEVSKKNKQLHEYEGMIRDLEDKVNEIMNEKEEEGRFDMVRVQANTILEKENEIIRLNKLLTKANDNQGANDNQETNDNQEANQDKIMNVLTMMDEPLSEDNTIDVVEIEEEKKEKEDKDEEEDEGEGEEDEGEDESDDYEILTYRKKEYWIKVGEDPQIVYEVLGDDCLGNRLGIYKKDTKGKMKVFLDKK